MSLYETINDEIKKAMLARDKVKLDTVRGIKKEFLEAKTAKGGDGELSDEVAIKILNKMAKQRKESAEIFIFKFIIKTLLTLFFLFIYNHSFLRVST